LPEKIAASFSGTYELLVHKYYVDELYGAIFIKPLINGSTKILWQGIDRKMIDGTVNDAGDAARRASDEVRHMQSGNIRSYAGWVAAGSAAVIAFMIWVWTGVR
jgi:NADH-quinone oxidoreductase subunit L